MAFDRHPLVGPVNRGDFNGIAFREISLAEEVIGVFCFLVAGLCLQLNPTINLFARLALPPASLPKVRRSTKEWQIQTMKFAKGGKL